VGHLEGVPVRPTKRADARRNEETLLDAAAAAFVRAGVDVPVRDVAALAGVGVGTVYRHFPTRADLIVAVYRHQVESCADAGPALLATSASPHAALASWINVFVDFLVTKHGLAEALQSDIDALELLFGVGNLCIGSSNNPRYDPRRMVELLVAGLRGSTRV
jgi:AcrR family transcriptional regulator